MLATEKTKVREFHVDITKIPQAKAETGLEIQFKDGFNKVVNSKGKVFYQGSYYGCQEFILKKFDMRMSNITELNFIWTKW